MFVKILGAALLSTVALSASAGTSVEPGVPGSATDVLKMYPDAVKVRDGVYTVRHGDRTRTFLFGAGGRRYHADYLASMRKMIALHPSPDASALVKLDNVIAATRRSAKAIEARESNIAKGTHIEDMGYCGWRTWVDVDYAGGWTTADAYARVESFHDFSTPSVGRVHVHAFAFKYNDNFLQSSIDSPVVAPGVAEAGVTDTFGGVQCTMSSSGSIQFLDTPVCEPDWTSWIAEGPCV